MNFIDRIKTFFKTLKVNPVAIAVCDTFRAASDSYDVAACAVQSYTIRAHNRDAIIRAKHTLFEHPLDDSCAADAYDEAVAEFTNPADFEPYTEAYLDSHTAAIDSLTAAFDVLTTAFVAFNTADDFYILASDLYNAHCEQYSLAANAYDKAARCALITTLEGNCQAARDKFDLWLLEIKADNPNETNPGADKTKANAFKAKATEHATKAKSLEQKARAAETSAKVFLLKARAAEERAKEALKLCS